jgi:fibronectin-binding autotransporter adhesin
MKLSNKFILACFLATSSLAHGQSTVTWDQTNANNAWNTIDANWTSGATFVTGDNVIFNSASGETVTVATGGVSAGTIDIGANNGSWTLAGGSITGGALTKSGSGFLTIQNANTFSSISVSQGPNTQALGALNLGNANALGTAAITFTNTTAITGLNFLSGFGATGDLTNNITFTSSAVQTRLLATANLSPTTQTVTLSGKLSGGSASSPIRVDNTVASGSSIFKLTNSTNDVRVSIWEIWRGGLEFTSDAALGNVNNDLKLNVGANSDPIATGLIFGANNITLNSNRLIEVADRTNINTQSFTGSRIDGAITFTGTVVKKGSTSLLLNAAGTGGGGIRVDAGSIALGNSAAMGTGSITFNTTGNAILQTQALSGSVVIANNIVLTNPGAAGSLGILAKAGTGNSVQLNGVISGGGANTTLRLDTDTAGDITSRYILNNANTYSGKTYINRGSVQLNNAAGFGTSAVQFDSDLGASLIFNSSMTVSNNISYTYRAKKINTGTNDVILSGVQDFSVPVSKEGSGKLTLTAINTGTATTSITAGTLALSGTGSIASNSIIVGASTTFDVSGVTGGYSLASGKTISGTGLVTGAVTINGTIAPGNSPGDLSFGDNLTLAGTLNLEVTDDAATMFDRLVGDGANTLALGGVLNLNNTGYSALLGDTVTVFSNWSSITGSFSSITGTDLGGGLSWDTSHLGTLGTMTVIPESSTALLGGLGGLLMLRRRRA